MSHQALQIGWSYTCPGFDLDGNEPPWEVYLNLLNNAGIVTLQPMYLICEGNEDFSGAICLKLSKMKLFF